MDDIVTRDERRAEATRDERSAEAPARPTRDEAEAAVRTLIAWAGDNPDREGLLDTPAPRGQGLRGTVRRLSRGPRASTLARVFDDVDGYKDLVLVRDIPFVSHCEHHIAPFFGKAHIAYYPRRGVVGLSKLARIVDTFARRLQTQEALSAQIVDAIDGALNTRGVAVMIEAEHTCMSMRGVRKKDGVSTVTTQFTGVFADNPARTDEVPICCAGRAENGGFSPEPSQKRAGRSRRASSADGLIDLRGRSTLTTASC